MPVWQDALRASAGLAGRVCAAGKLCAAAAKPQSSLHPPEAAISVLEFGDGSV